MQEEELTEEERARLRGLIAFQKVVLGIALRWWWLFVVVFLALLALFHQLSSGHIVTPKSTKYRMAYPTGCTLYTRSMPYVNYFAKSPNI